MSSLRELVLGSPAYQGGAPFGPSDIPEAIAIYGRRGVSSMLSNLSKEDIVCNVRRGVWVRATPLSRGSLSRLAEDVNAGRTTVLAEAHKYPCSYNTLRKHLRQSQLGVGRYA